MLLKWLGRIDVRLKIWAGPPPSLFCAHDALFEVEPETHSTGGELTLTNLAEIRLNLHKLKIRLVDYPKGHRHCKQSQRERGMAIPMWMGLLNKVLKLVSCNNEPMRGRVNSLVN